MNTVKTKYIIIRSVRKEMRGNIVGNIAGRLNIPDMIRLMFPDFFNTAKYRKNPNESNYKKDSYMINL